MMGEALALWRRRRFGFSACAKGVLMFVGVALTQSALAAEDSAQSWAAVIDRAALVEISGDGVAGVAQTDGSVRQYRQREWQLLTRHESSAEVGPAAILLCNGLLLANLDHFRTEADGTPRPQPAAEAAWWIALRMFSAHGLARGLQSIGLFLPESGQTHLQALADDALWEGGPVRARVSHSAAGDITIRLEGGGARDSEGVRGAFQNEIHIRGNRSMEALPPSMSVRGWSAIGGGQFYTVGQARRAGRGCPSLPDSPVWPFQ